jgi:hypothetical protein
MVARVTHVKVRPDHIEEAVCQFDDSVIPAAEQEEGFMGALLLTLDDRRALVVDLSTPSSTCAPTSAAASSRRRWPSSPASSWTAGARVYDVAVAKGVQGGPELLRSVE